MVPQTSPPTSNGSSSKRQSKHAFFANHTPIIALPYPTTQQTQTHTTKHNTTARSTEEYTHNIYIMEDVYNQRHSLPSPLPLPTILLLVGGGGIRRWLGDACLMDGWIYADQSATGIYTCATQHIILCCGPQEESPLPFDLTASLTSFIVFVVTHHSFLNWSGWEMEEALPRGPSPASQYYLDEAPPASLTPTTSHNNIFNVISL